MSYICLPHNDNKKRFILGVRGEKELLAIALNPSTANETKLDPTSRNIQFVANKHGFDGWWLFNLYPKRTPHPSKLPLRMNKPLFEENLNFLNRFLIEESNTKAILVCWGNEIKNRTYLQNSAAQILTMVENIGLPIYCIGKTKAGNPYHPAPTPLNRFLGGIGNVNLIHFKK